MSEEGILEGALVLSASDLLRVGYDNDLMMDDSESCTLCSFTCNRTADS
jgi:hypothetical protein